MFLGVWIAAGQSLSNILPYFKHSLTVTAGYGEAMSISGDQAQLLLGWGCLFTGLAAVALSMRRANRPLQCEGILGVMALALAWKQGFGRQDSVHTNLFFVQA